MKLIVFEVKSDGVYQEVSPNRNVIVEAIRPHLYVHGNPSGTVKVQIQDASGDLITESEALTIADISNATYFHGKVRFYIDAYLKKDETYRIAIVGASGYSFSESAYVGVCNSFDLSTYDASYAPSVGYQAPLAIEVWERKP